MASKLLRVQSPQARIELSDSDLVTRARTALDLLEFDFFRTLTNFKSMAHAKVVSQEERDMMTDLMRRVRRMTEEVGAR